MSGSWSQPAFQQPPQNISRHISGNRPPICFNCGEEGHFMISCPEPRRSDTIPLNPPTHQQYSAPTVMSGPQGFSQPLAPPQTPYQPYPQNQQYGSSIPQPQYQFAQGPFQQGSYTPGPPLQPSYSAPPPQPVTYANQPYSYPPNQFPNTFGPQQFGHGPPSQYNVPQPNGPQSYGPPQPQQYGPPQGPAPYQPQPVTYQEPQLNGSFHGNFPPASSNFQAPTNQQWNSAPPSTWNAPPYQRQQRNYSDSSNFAGAPVFQSQQQHSRRSSQQNSQRSSNDNNQQQFPRNTQPMKHASAAQSKPSSSASTPHGEREMTANSVGKEADSRPASKKTVEEIKESEALETQQFEWELEKIFKLPATHDIVALAQPLSHDFDLSPVPQLNPLGACISRYASKDNSRQFTRSVRDASDWPFRKEDPAFAEINFDSPLIPLREVPAWMEAKCTHQSDAEDILMNDATDTSRKRRLLGEADGQNDSDTQPDLENIAEKKGGQQPKKRQKTRTARAKVDERAGTPEMTTMFYENRDGTPCLAADDDNDAWAPQPGEGADPVDPTEALLASLGVTGSPKPVDNSPLPPYQPLPEHSSPSTIKNSSPLTQKEPPTPKPATSSNVQSKVVHTRRREGNSKGPHQQFKPPPPMLNTQNQPLQFPPSGGAPPHSAVSLQPQFSLPAQAPYQNAIPNNSQYGFPQNGPSNNMHFGSNTGHGNEQYGNSFYTNNNNQSGPPHNNNSTYSNNMSGPPQNGNPVYPQGSNYQQPNNTQYAPPANPPYPNGNAQNAPYVPGPGPQSQQPQFAPDSNQNNNFAGQQQPPHYQSSHPDQLTHNPQGNNNHSHESNYQQYGPDMQNNAPSRQDSGYGSAGGFGSNSSSQNNVPVQQNPRDQSQRMKIHPPDQHHDGLTRNGNDINSNQSTNGNIDNETQAAASKETPVKQHNHPGNISSPNSNSSDREDSPLSDNSKDILGLLDNRKKKGPKRPAPIVEAAYSRRW